MQKEIKKKERSETQYVLYDHASYIIKGGTKLKRKPKTTVYTSWRWCVISHRKWNLKGTAKMGSFVDSQGKVGSMNIKIYKKLTRIIPRNDVLVKLSKDQLSN